MVEDIPKYLSPKNFLPKNHSDKNIQASPVKTFFMCSSNVCLKQESERTAWKQIMSF